MSRNESLMRVAKKGCVWEDEGRVVTPKGNPLNPSRTRIPKGLSVLNKIRLMLPLGIESGTPRRAPSGHNAGRAQVLESKEEGICGNGRSTTRVIAPGGSKFLNAVELDCVVISAEYNA